MAYNGPGPVGSINWKQIMKRMASSNSAGLATTTGGIADATTAGNGYKMPGAGKKKINWSNMADTAKGIVPYASNLANFFRKPPNAPMPNLVGAVSLSNPSFSAERNDIDRQTRGLSKAFDTSLDANAATAAKIGNNIQGLRATGQSYEQENNAKVNVQNGQAQINANISALNAGKLDQYGQNKVEMQIANQREQSENVANAADKFVQGEYRTDMMNLDKTKYGILSQAYANSGVTNRLVNRILGKGEDYTPTDEETQRVVSGATHMYGGKMKKMYATGGGLSRSEDYGSSKHPYASVASSDFAGGGRSYPIPTSADAVDALKLARMHGREDVIAKVHARYPGLKAMGGPLGIEGPGDKKPSAMELATANQFAKTFAKVHIPMIGEDAHVGNSIPKFVDEAGRNITGQPAKPGFKLNTQVPSYVTSLQYDDQMKYPYYVDQTSGDNMYVPHEYMNLPRFKQPAVQVQNDLAMHGHGGKLKRPISKVNKNTQSIPPEMASSYQSYMLGGKLGKGVQFPRMRGRIRKAY
jgi:hypothetical protein